MDPERKLEELGYALRLPPTLSARPYEPLVQVGRIVYGSGNTSLDRHAGTIFAGKVGAEVDVETARQYARIAMLNALAAFKSYLGELGRIERFVRLTGYVNSAPDFTRQAEVINGASELLREVFGDRGRHARSAIGVAQLPGGASVEVEAIIELTEE